VRPQSRPFRTALLGLTPEGSSHMVLHKDKVETANSHLNEGEANPQEDKAS